MDIINRYKNRRYEDMLIPEGPIPEDMPELPEPDYDDEEWMARALPPGCKHERAGFTKNKGRGQGETRRRMAKASRRRNRIR